MAVLEPIYRLFESWIDPFKPHGDTQPPGTLGAFVWHYAKQAKWAFAAMLGYGLLNALVEASLFTFVGQLVDILGGLETSGLKTEGWGGLVERHGPQLMLMLAVVAIGRGLVIGFGALIEEQVIVPGFFTLMRWQSHRHVVRQSLSLFQNDLSGRIAQKVVQSGQAAGDMLISALQIIWFIAVYAFTTMALLAVLDWRLGAIVGVWMLLFVLIARIFVPRIREGGRAAAEAMAGVSGRLVDGYGNIAAVKLNAGPDAEDGFVEEAMREAHRQVQTFTRSLSGVRITLSMTSGLVMAALGFASIDLWLRGAISTGEVAFALALALRLNLLLGRLMGNLNGFFRAMGTTQNSMETIAQPLQMTDAPGAPALHFNHGEIRLEGITFRYGKGPVVIDGLSLTIRPGEKLGLVGPSGAGKTTLAHLLLRFHDPESGRILLDGQDIKAVTQDSLRPVFSMVRQDTALFHRSVRDNIAYGTPGASFDAVVAAAKKASAHDFILPLQDAKGRSGYDARVGERGVKLSGGQRQRIAIAQVFLKNAPILVLDEATSQLDSEVEAAIQENLFALMEGKTVIAIAHRLSTLAQLDRLVVLDRGRIAEQGSHASLLAAGGIYARLWKRQSGGFIGDKLAAEEA